MSFVGLVTHGLSAMSVFGDRIGVRLLIGSCALTAAVIPAAAGWTRVADPMPRVRFVPEWRVVDSPGTLSGIDIRRTALVTEDLRATPGIDAKAKLVVDEQGRMLVDVSTRGPALLVTTKHTTAGAERLEQSEQRSKRYPFMATIWASSWSLAITGCRPPSSRTAFAGASTHLCQD